MADENSGVSPHLIVNRAEVVTVGCGACGNNFALDPTGNRVLTASIGQSNDLYLFCAQCGDSIMGHVQSEAIRQHYGWDWVIPLRGRPLTQATNN